jgi:hypothetical protein
MTHPSAHDVHLSPDRWFRLFENEHLTLVRIDVAPFRDEHVNTLASRLADIAGQASGRITIDLSMVEDYSWPWIRSLLDLSIICADMGGELNIKGMNDQGTRLMKANRTLSRPVQAYSRRPDPQPPPALSRSNLPRMRGTATLRAA